MSANSEYAKLAALAFALEAELKSLHAWSDVPLAPGKFKDMGAFGSNTMSFEQWIQFVLLKRLQQIIAENDVLPSGSMISTYAIREFDGNPAYDSLMDLLRQLDDLANGETPDDDPAF